jgi:hypothetical protein
MSDSPLDDPVAQRAARIAYLEGLCASQRMSPDELAAKVAEAQASLDAQAPGASSELRRAHSDWLNSK